MKLLASTWALWVLTLCSVQAAKDICNAKPKDIPLEPMCIYRSPDSETQPTEKPEKKPAGTNPRVWELSKANSRFALSFFKQLAKGKSNDENIFLSPISISTAFAMTKLGACNTTLEELMKVFQFDTIKEKTSDQVHYFFAKLNCRLYSKKHETTKLFSANRLFGDKSILFNESYQDISEMVYGAKLLPLDFKGKPEVSRMTINEWIANKTENQIKDTLPEGSIDSNTILVLVNTVYFKGQWKHRFDKENTMNSDFHVSETHKCQVTMMTQERNFQYATIYNDKVMILELPYNGADITMVLILPFEGTTLSEVVENMNLKKLEGWLQDMRETTVSVQLPRFRIEDNFSLKEQLMKMGLEHLFSPGNASLPGMVADGGHNLYISNAYHKAFLEVNEDGSKAAATTAVVTTVRSLSIYAKDFIADRPFLLLIRKSSINTLIFTGRVANPCGSS
ncbi:antithrombin-III-like [Carassius gibelio]|uniref:antithrombin-III-like n=1 Tax=Carassius gibelio TaxID=101364 RepID=UPI0022781CB9|nr:antithrombin-III-like [Carassius gibelio]XP_052395402.1 antithrombin-III-like [Carassius gibelio]